MEGDELWGDALLIEAQDAVRAAFGWELADDLASARNLLTEVEARAASGGPNAVAWSAEGRLAILDIIAGVLERDRSAGRGLTVLGAACEPSDVLDAIVADHVIIAADGAIGVLNEVGGALASEELSPAAAALRDAAWLRVRLIVSDADGEAQDLERANRRGIPIALHGHGDNQPAWTSLLNRLGMARAPLILTHQTPTPIEGMHNPGGFTDGDRAACLAIALGWPGEEIHLAGFRTDKIGRWTGATDPEQKMRKLEWMAEILRVAGVQW